MWPSIVLSVLICSTSLIALPLPEHATGSGERGTKADIPVEQLEKLKLNAEGGGSIETSANGGLTSEHIEYHRLDAVQANGELVSRLEQHASAYAAPGEKPKLHSHVHIDLPAEGVHKEIVQDGDKVAVHEGTVPTTTASGEELTTKVFHGAARLIQAGTGAQVPQGAHTAVRRAFNFDVNKEHKHNVDPYSSNPGVQYSPLDMAEYVLWTGDERGVTAAIEEFLQEGMMTKEEAIMFLQEIKLNLDFLRAHSPQNVKAAEEAAAQQQQEKLRAMLIEQANAKESYQHRPPSFQSFPFGNNPDIIRAITNKNYEMSNSLTPNIPMLSIGDFKPEAAKRTFDPMLQTNIVGTSDYDRDGPMITEEEYEEMMDKLKAADSLYTEYTLEEIIYQLAKMMFSQSMTRDPREARAAIQRFMAFLEVEAERGQLSRSIEKKVLDVMVAALTDTIGDHPEALQGREGLALNNGNRLMHQFWESSVSEPGMSRAILAAYKDELLKGSPLHKLAFTDRN